MANEITVTGRLKVSKSGAVIELSRTNLSFDLTGSNFIHHVQPIGTSEEAIDLGQLAQPSWAIFINLDATNFVSLRQATGASDMIKLSPGGIALFEFDADCTAPFAIADTAGCDIEYVVVED